MIAQQRANRASNPERHRAYGLKYRETNPEKTLLRAAKLRARQGGYPCTITETDIVIPERCPLLGIKLKRGFGVGGVKGSSPSLDKIKPKLGYIPGNVWVISHRANSIKRDATLQEIKLLIANWSALHGDV